MDPYPSYEDLKASGCTNEEIQQFSECSCKKEQLRFLQKHRDSLLGHIHEEEEQIQTLDYLTYQLQKSKS